MFTATKIVCTIGPSVNTYDKICALIDSGMDVARLNCSHGTHELHATNISLLKRARKEKGKPLALMLDLRGPKVCVKEIKGGEISLKKGQKLILAQEGNGTNKIQINPFAVYSVLEKGMTVLFDDGRIISKVVDIDQSQIIVEIQNPGILKSNKGVNIPDTILPFPKITNDDLTDLKFGLEQEVDFIAASFIQSPAHIEAIKDVISSKIPVIAKIEDIQGVENFEKIMLASDGIMVARGDLGVEVDLAKIPRLQKMMIKKCIENGKIVITATQMLDSMVKHPRPTRAEVSDVANAIYDSSSSIMLSAETAVGNHPIEAVELMKKIAVETELDLQVLQEPIFATEREGEVLSVKRKSAPIFVYTNNRQKYHQLALSWGVFPIFATSLKKAKEFALEKGLIRKKT